ncbi:MAG: stage III sporulation protein AF [Peptococcaceae bacterium]|jgi:stage III sporulation protein AF|nr:stage III sporulation protein AF [Peptococcaceae bacterium]MBQ2369988.1 stage III sporulation protein AF [Peptococcaceae bacterium]MBQ5615329.1 stage III sporulation protein AF [Peptococcaceae bacterium]MBQ5707944.1 stage III sporulation protein AF [Peptococcaceae bacterium]
MELIRNIMLNIIILVFFTATLDYLLPEGSFRSYIKMAMGVILVLIILQPVVQILQINETYKEAYRYDNILE